MEFKALGKQSRFASKELDTFPAPEGVTVVRLTSNELTSLCPVTGQPDFSTVVVEYNPDKLCVESKSFKLYLWSFRDEAAFCEALAAQIARDVFEATKAHRVHAKLTQSVRGGIVIEAEAEYSASSN
jgi:7-cyano-7-deazaguanine reductase